VQAAETINRQRGDPMTTATLTRPDVIGPAFREIGLMLRSPAFVRLAVADVKRRRRIAEQRRAARLSQHDPAPNTAIRRDLRKLADQERALADAREAKNRKAVSAALSEIHRLKARIETERTRQLNVAWAGRAVAESAALALARGEQVEDEEVETHDWKRGKHGEIKRRKGVPQLITERAIVKRVQSRTGLELAFRRGDLDGAGVRAEALLHIGTIYREAWITANAQRGPVREEGVPSSPRCKASLGPAEAIFEAQQTLLRLREGRVRGEDGKLRRMEGAWMTRRQIAILDAVCGQDMALGAAAKALRMGYPALRRGLKAGLVVAWENRGIG